MTALSIHLPDKLVKASQEAAEELGVSRAQFIRQAVIHELESFQAQRELESMAASFRKMSKKIKYMKELDEIEKGFDNDLVDEKEDWWKKKS